MLRPQCSHVRGPLCKGQLFVGSGGCKILGSSLYIIVPTRCECVVRATSCIAISGPSRALVRVSCGNRVLGPVLCSAVSHLSCSAKGCSSSNARVALPAKLCYCAINGHHNLVGRSKGLVARPVCYTFCMMGERLFETALLSERSSMLLGRGKRIMRS